jgi:rfaE bifunctional protein nucleotidyltransferase chain/domain
MCAWKLPPPLRDEIPEKFVPDLEALCRRIESLKQGGKRVVFTNGGFDLLHVGHVRSLRHARALGDHLVVAVNSDASVQRAKGPNRPLFPLAERLEIVASLACVDTVFVFEDDTADRLLGILKPHVHAKGPDYLRHGVPERATVLGYGGEIAIVGDTKDHSSSELQQRIARLLVEGPGPSR